MGFCWEAVVDGAALATASPGTPTPLLMRSATAPLAKSRSSSLPSKSSSLLPIVSVADEADAISVPTMGSTDESELDRGEDDGDDAEEVENDDEDEVDAEGGADGDLGGSGVVINEGICSAIGFVIGLVILLT